jgi:mannose-6-phosphate isomerase-like protein (cupin superfamily)
MDVQQYINSGVLEEYCLGRLSEEQEAFVIQMTMLYPEVKAELTQVELALEKLANDNAQPVNPDIRNAIISAIGHTFSDAVLDINNLPEIKKTSDHESWLKCVEHLIPNEIPEFTALSLRHTEAITQLLVVSKIDVPQESHGDVFESLLILKGACECTIGDTIIRMETGDYIDIPLHVDHNIKILSPYVIAIVQHKSVA